jgi:hypothetical protein
MSFERAQLAAPAAIDDSHTQLLQRAAYNGPNDEHKSRDHSAGKGEDKTTPFQDFSGRLQEYIWPAGLSGILYEPLKLPALTARFPAEAFASKVPLWGEFMQASALNRHSTAAEWEMMQKPMAIGVAKALGTTVGVIGADIAMDRLIFKKQPEGLATSIADNVVTPLALIAPGSWLVKGGVAIGAHALGRVLDSYLLADEKKRS